MSASVLRRPEVTLDDKYEAATGTALLTGIQALVRVPLDQRRLDEARGHNTAAFVSGYQGSPLGGLDRELHRARGHLSEARVVFRPGLNEELAATAVGGTQLLGELDGRRHDGVVGFWFGKNPGLDRAADAIRHANVSGTAPLGGAVAWIGDDPASKSSTVPSASEAMCRSLLMPLLTPGRVGDVLRLGLHAVALSREAGLWAAMKIVADIADASSVVHLDGLLEEIPDAIARRAASPPVLLPPANLDAEYDLMTTRLERASAYAARAGLNAITHEPSRPRIAVVAAGMAYQSVLRALGDLSISAEQRDALGLRLVRLDMPWPLEPAHLLDLVSGVETVLVVEDKLPFVEAQVKTALYGNNPAPTVLGKRDASGNPLLTERGSLSADEIGRALARVVDSAHVPEAMRGRTERPLRVRRANGEVPRIRRTPYFCSGCPHNVSTRARPGELVGAGIGCHIMVALEEGDRRGQLVGMPQMGGEGAQWLGLEPFTSEDHFIQNIGDGTFHHSGSLAVRAAVAAGARMTFRLLYNDAVAMTGGQRAEGRLGVPELTQLLATEGVKRIIVTTPDPKTYRGLALNPITSVRHRDELEQAQEELAAVDGVTVLIHDDRCATEKRRLRKRGKLETPAERVWINERVCEGCGDCGEKSSCLSVTPVETEFGRKTQVHQSSCNQDFSCLRGDCPSFLLVTPRGRAMPKPSRPEIPVALPDPVHVVPRESLVRMVGIGGTGVLTVSQILQMAAQLDGRFAASVEQTGLAQKGGPVISDLRFADTAIEGSLRATLDAADALIGFDLVGASGQEALRVVDADRTVAALSTSLTPTAAMVTTAQAGLPDAASLVRRVEGSTRAEALVRVDTEALAQRVFGDHMPANMLLTGAAFQRGYLPVTAAAVERAIELNGAAVEANLAAFNWGRAVAADAEAVERALGSPTKPGAALDSDGTAIVEATQARGELRRLLEVRVPELVAYQGAAYARRYAEDVADVARAVDMRAGGAGSAVSEAYARGLFKLMAYKDEYEVARLHLDSLEQVRREDAFGRDAKVRLLLHPPILRALGLRRKLRLGRWAFVLLRVLVRLRGLRGTSLDPFGFARVRQIERQLIEEYRSLVRDALGVLDDTTVSQVTEVAALPDLVRGYEEVKLRNVARFRARAEELLSELDPRTAEA